MSFKQVKELRHAGSLEEAYKAATEDLNAAPDDIWNKRSLGWVLHDYLKHFAAMGDFGHFLKYLGELSGLLNPVKSY